MTGHNNVLLSIRIRQFLIVWISITIFQACKKKDIVPPEILQTNFEAKNASYKDVTIYLFKPDNRLLKVIILDAGDSAIINGSMNPGNGNFYFYDHLDSARIEFSDGKTLVQTFGKRARTDSVNNILDPHAYKVFWDRRRFTLTIQDYYRAK